MMQNRDPALESHRERAWREVAAIEQAYEDVQLDEAGWHAAMAAIIKPAYLAADNPYAQAGHGGDATTWEESRGFIADALDRSGTFLDVGCASGIMMQSVQRWGTARGLQIQPYGLEIIPELADLTRSRLPQWHDRIFVGNIRNWTPFGEPFDYVLIRPEYAPRSRRADMVRHILQHVLKRGGRLIVFVGAEEADTRRVEQTAAAGGMTIHGRAERPHPRDSRLVHRLFWIDGLGRSP